MKHLSIFITCLLISMLILQVHNTSRFLNDKDGKCAKKLMNKSMKEVCAGVKSFIATFISSQNGENPSLSFKQLISLYIEKLVLNKDNKFLNKFFANKCIDRAFANAVKRIEKLRAKKRCPKNEKEKEKEREKEKEKEREIEREKEKEKEIPKPITSSISRTNNASGRRGSVKGTDVLAQLKMKKIKKY
jgi:hypothetical protein